MATGTRSPKRRAATPPKPSVRREPYLEPNDFRRHLLEKSVLVAPGDVESLVGMRDEVLAKIARDCGEHHLLRAQLRVAIDLLDDHVTHRSPQIPYHTISVLAAAVLYFMNPLDVIPDFIGDVGKSDDALLVELAFEMVWPGIERYCLWKDIPTANLRAPQKRARRRR